MFRKKKKKRPEISAPKNFEHRVHTSFDAKHGCFVGLPTQWQSLIENLRRPKPMVDPSRITEVELRPKKVGRTSGCRTRLLARRRRGTGSVCRLNLTAPSMRDESSGPQTGSAVSEKCHNLSDGGEEGSPSLLLYPSHLCAFLSIMGLR